jgi:hypothetical protein
MMSYGDPASGLGTRGFYGTADVVHAAGRVDRRVAIVRPAGATCD